MKFEKCDILELRCGARVEVKSEFVEVPHVKAYTIEWMEAEPVPERNNISERVLVDILGAKKVYPDGIYRARVRSLETMRDIDTVINRNGVWFWSHTGKSLCPVSAERIEVIELIGKEV
jgi:hypothetical protein